MECYVFFFLNFKNAGPFSAGLHSHACLFLVGATQLLSKNPSWLLRVPLERSRLFRVNWIGTHLHSKGGNANFNYL